MRLKPKEAGDVVNNGAPIKVRFPSVREKLKVLQASRNVTRILRERRITILEDFTDQVWKSKKAKQRFSFPPVKVMLNAFQLQVLRHRQALASFARRRARKTKKKWALKYDELYYNGRVFVFDEDSERVVAAWRRGVSAADEQKPICQKFERCPLDGFSPGSTRVKLENS